MRFMERRPGGGPEGGTRLTPEGRRFLDRYQRFRRGLDREAARRFKSRSGPERRAGGPARRDARRVQTLSSSESTSCGWLCSNAGLHLGPRHVPRDDTVQELDEAWRRRDDPPRLPPPDAPNSTVRTTAELCYESAARLGRGAARRDVQHARSGCALPGESAGHPSTRRFEARVSLTGFSAATGYWRDRHGPVGPRPPPDPAVTAVLGAGLAPRSPRPEIVGARGTYRWPRASARRLNSTSSAAAEDRDARRGPSRSASSPALGVARRDARRVAPRPASNHRVCAEHAGVTRRTAVASDPRALGPCARRSTASPGAGCTCLRLSRDAPGEARWRRVAGKPAAVAGNIRLGLTAECDRRARESASGRAPRISKAGDVTAAEPRPARPRDPKEDAIEGDGACRFSLPRMNSKEPYPTATR